MDNIDKQILNILQLNGRVTNKSIADSIGLSTPAVLERIRKLEKNGTIKGYKAIIDPDKIDKHITAILAITIDRGKEFQVDNVKEAIKRCNDIKSFYFTTGKYDFFIVVALENIKALEEFIMKRISTIIPSVKNVETFIVLSSDEDLGYNIPLA